MTWVKPQSVRSILSKHHYLGSTTRGSAWFDRRGVLVFASPTSRRLPSSWLDLTRWCILSREKNAGSMQWAVVKKALLEKFPEVTTVVSYSDPSQGHSGSLYRACNWWWAPTWHRLRPPPTGQGTWDGVTVQAVKDRWIFPLRPDPARVELASAKDESILRRMPWARYREPGGADFKQWKLHYIAPPPLTPPYG